MTIRMPGKAPGATPAPGPEPSIWTRLLNTTWKKVAWAVGTPALAALVTLAITLMYQGTQVDHFKAVADAQQAEIGLLNQRVDAFDSSNKELAIRLATAQKSLSGVCSAVRSAAVSGQYSLPNQLQGTCGVRFSIVTMQRPQAGDRVRAVTEAAGTADVKGLNGRAIWFAVDTRHTWLLHPRRLAHEQRPRQSHGGG